MWRGVYGRQIVTAFIEESIVQDDGIRYVWDRISLKAYAYWISGMEYYLYRDVMERVIEE